MLFENSTGKNPIFMYVFENFKRIFSANSLGLNDWLAF
jgi:hypothetical protein